MITYSRFETNEDQESSKVVRQLGERETYIKRVHIPIATLGGTQEARDVVTHDGAHEGRAAVRTKGVSATSAKAI